MLKIIAGKYKNRIIPTKKNHNYRPSTAKLREAIFSILTAREFTAQPVLTGSKVLDLFAGTGSLGFEALSRGAAKITCIDIVADYLRDAKSFASKIGETGNVGVLRLNATSLPKATSSYDLIFMDPPYRKNFVEKTLISLLKGEWLSAGAILVVEASILEDFQVPRRLQPVKCKVYGDNKLVILKYTDS